MQNQFSFSKKLIRVGNRGTAGIYVTFTHGLNNLPVADMDSVINDLKFARISDAKVILKTNPLR